MTIPSRFHEAIPNCSLQQWIFESPHGPLPDSKLFLDADRPDTHFITKARYRLLAKQIAVGLLARGLKPGQRVLLFSGNNIVFPSIFLGILMAGGIFTGANPGYVARELAYQLNDSDATFMIAAEASLDVALEAAKAANLPKENIYILDTNLPGVDAPPGNLGTGPHHWTKLLAPEAEAQKFAWTEPTDSRTSTCCLNYSSGTTGLPKGVEITHSNYVANCTGVVKFAELEEGYAAKLPRQRGLCFLPLYHAYAQSYFVANFAKQAIPVYVMPRFDLVKFLTHIQEFRITSITAVPPILVGLTKHPIARNFDLSSVESVGCGAAPLGKDVVAEVERMLPYEALSVRQGWGMTEVTCSAMGWDPALAGNGSSVGELMPNCSARLVGEDGKDVTTANVPGELWISGPTVMKGYWKKPQATADTLVYDDKGVKWLRTGDVAYVDSYGPGGVFFIVDRIKELIKVKGNQVAPAELEALLLERPDVLDVAVIGVTIDGEELPRAYVVRAPTSKATETDIAKWLAERVVRHKRLAGGVSFVEAIPKNPSGKILRKVLREKAKQETSPSSKL